MCAVVLSKATRIYIVLHYCSGRYDYVILVVDWLQQKIGVRPYQGYRATGEKGLHSHYTIDSEGQPKRILTMEEGGRAAAGTARGTGPSTRVGG